MKEKNAFLSLSHAKKLSTLLYFLLLILLPTQLGKHFWPTYSLLSGFRVDYLSPTLYLTDCLIILLFVSEVVSLKHIRFNRTATHFLLILFFLICTVLQSVAPMAGWYSLLKVVEMGFVAWYTAHHIASPLCKHVIPTIILTTVLFESVLAILQLLAKGYLGGGFYYLGERAITSGTPGAATVVINGEIILRSYGTFSHPNVLAGFLVIMMTYLLLQRASLRFPYGKWLLASGLIVGTIGIGTTLSRIPIALWMGILGVASVWKLRLWSLRPLPYRMLIGGGAALYLVFFFALPLAGTVIGRFGESRIFEESLIVRSDLNTHALTIIQENPVLGVGLGNILFHMVTFKAPADPLYFAVQPVHNIFLYVAAETGILGLLLFLWLLFLAFGRATITGRTLLGLVLLLGMFDHYFLTLQQGQLLLALVIGYCFAPFRKSR